jgi:hypothetical protein
MRCFGRGGGRWCCFEQPAVVAAIDHLGLRLFLGWTVGVQLWRVVRGGVAGWWPVVLLSFSDFGLVRHVVSGRCHAVDGSFESSVWKNDAEMRR